MDIRILQRLVLGPRHAYGVIVDGDQALCPTIERPWLNNEKNVSCVTAGLYLVVRHDSPSKGLCWKLRDVSGRSDILIHAANRVLELQGCIAPGMKFGDIEGVPAVLDSRAAMEMLFARWGSKDFILHIKDPPS